MTFETGSIFVGKDTMVLAFMRGRSTQKENLSAFSRATLNGLKRKKDKMKMHEHDPAGLLSVRTVGTLRGHHWEEDIWISPNGTRLVSTAYSSSDPRVLLWNPVEQTLLATLEGHQDKVFACAYTQDSQWFATACDDGLVRVWSADGDLRLALAGHTGGARGVAFVSSSRLLSCDTARILRLWDLSTGLVLLTQSGDPETETPEVDPSSPLTLLFPMACAPEQGVVAINCPSTHGNVHMWALDQERLRLRWLGTSWTSYGNFQVAFSPDGRMLVLLEEEKEGTSIRLRTGPRFERETLLTLPAAWDFSDLLIQCSFSPEGRYLAIGEYDGGVGIWDLQAQVPVGRFQAYISLRHEAAPMPTLTGLDWSASGVLATAGFAPLDERYALGNGFVATLWQLEIAERRDGKQADRTTPS